MDNGLKTIAETCLQGAESDTMTFPQIIAVLMEAGFESYEVDFRRATATYFLPTGDSIELTSHGVSGPVAPKFDSDRIEAAIREAQTQAPGYTYQGFCSKVSSSGCAGYMVSFSGRRAVYFGRTAETHVELFPQSAD